MVYLHCLNILSRFGQPQQMCNMTKMLFQFVLQEPSFIPPNMKESLMTYSVENKVMNCESFSFFKGVLFRGKGGPPASEWPAWHFPHPGRGFIRPPMHPWRLFPTPMGELP